MIQKSFPAGSAQRASVPSIKRRVTINLNEIKATRIDLVGDFNGWSLGRHPMRRGDLGVWGRTVLLPPGRYEYKFMVDGRWWHDPTRPECLNCHGTMNNYLEVR